MALRRYTVDLIRVQRQTVTFVADNNDMDGSDMQNRVAHAYAKYDGWKTDANNDISSLSSEALESDNKNIDIDYAIANGEDEGT